MKAYQVIGGQYEQFWYAESDSLYGAKIIVATCSELWGKWPGWKKPGIYKAEDCEEIESRGRITTPDGVIIRIHKPYAVPVG